MRNRDAMPAGVHRGAAIGFGKQYSKQRTTRVISESVVVRNEIVVMCVAVRRALFE